jgi:hypothetical protein
MRVLLLRLWATTALALLLVSGAQAASNFVLNENCPPSFEKMDNGSCELRNLYQFYDSLQDMGVGGTKTSLPAHRDGFSPQQIDLGRYLFLIRPCRPMGPSPVPAATIPTKASVTIRREVLVFMGRR